LNDATGTPERIAAPEPGVVGGITIRAAGQPTRAAVLSVGSELLLGDLTDTNATWISRRLKEQGVEVVHHLAVRDDLAEFVSALDWLAERTHLVIIGGGLGPTSDDLTREAVASTAGVELEHREDLAEEIARRFAAMDRHMAPANLKQAMIPAGADAWPPAGTAPAFGMTLTSPTPTRIIALPGVPWELHQLWDDHVAAEVAALAGRRVTVTRILHVVGRGESDVAAVVEPLVDARPEATLAFLAKAHEIQVRLTVSADDREAAFAASQPLVDEVTAALAGGVAGVDDEDLETVVLRMLTEAGQTVSTAESATGGDISARLARIPGASRALVGGAVVYAMDAKHDLLDVPTSLLDEHGSVSGPITEALAAGARARTGTDWAIAVTGVAGPGTVDGLPVGSCFWALAHPDGHVEVHGQRIPGDRTQVIARLGTVAIDLLRRRLAGT
jgi:nicotinamide-nucleotide amidase